MNFSEPMNTLPLRGPWQLPITPAPPAPSSARRLSNCELACRAVAAAPIDEDIKREMIRQMVLEDTIRTAQEYGYLRES
jgi:hypothetical protein